MENELESNKPKVIIVDDDTLALKTISDILSDTCEITTSQNPVDVLKMVGRENFDILISDYKMPRLSGITLIRGVTQINPDILPIVITGYANKEIALEALRNGAYDFIEKPIVPEMLIASISRAWEKIKILKVNKALIDKIKSYNKKLEEKNENLALKNEELKKAQAEVHRSAMKAGMTEVATNILHNVGNVLNSVNVSASYLNQIMKNSKVEILYNLLDLLKENEKNLANYLSNDEKGKLIPTLLEEIRKALKEESKKVLHELIRMDTSVEHIKSIISFQQNYATQPLIKEEFELQSLIQDVLSILEKELSNSTIKVNYDQNLNTKLFLPKYKIIHVLINLIRNANDSVLESQNANKEIKIDIKLKPLKIIIEDNGVGISKENIDKLFGHGFTTKKSGHGFGLHSSVLAINEIGASITAESEGLGHGAKFTITFPLNI